jgi:hypothetical protein
MNRECPIGPNKQIKFMSFVALGSTQFRVPEATSRVCGTARGFPGSVKRVPRVAWGPVQFWTQVRCLSAGERGILKGLGTRCFPSDTGGSVANASHECQKCRPHQARDADREHGRAHGRFVGPEGLEDRALEPPKTHGQRDLRTYVHTYIRRCHRSDGI